MKSYKLFVFGATMIIVKFVDMLLYDRDELVEIVDTTKHIAQ